PVIEVLVAVGDTVSAEDPLVTLESDKATMEVPSPAAGKVAEIVVSVGDKVKEGSPLVKLEVDGAAPSAEAAPAPTEERDVTAEREEAIAGATDEGVPAQPRDDGDRAAAAAPPSPPPAAPPEVVSPQAGTGA